MIVGWQLATHMRTDFRPRRAQNGALRPALPGADFTLVAHTDHGSHDRSARTTRRGSHDAKVLTSVGSVGDAYDNAMAESFVDSFKTELIRDRVWHSNTKLELAIVEYVAWFSNTPPAAQLDREPSPPSSTKPRVAVGLAPHTRTRCSRSGASLFTLNVCGYDPSGVVSDRRYETSSLT